MPELPDIELYLSALTPRIVGERILRIRLGSPFLLRSVAPPLADCENRQVVALRRVGKRIVFELEEEYFLVLHLMIAGRLQWKPAAAAIPKKLGLAAFDFADHTLLLTEAGTKKRASLFVVHRESNLAPHDPGGLDPLGCSASQFAAAMTDENHTLKRTLTDPSIFSGIGNAYSDEILHRAQLSPLLWSQRLTAEQIERLHTAVVSTLEEWRDRLIKENGTGFPKKVTAFRPEMAVHGKYRQPCPVCDSPVQRIAYAENEVNYCATCQTNGKVLADRGLSKLLGKDWPRSIEAWESLRRPATDEG